MGFLFDIYVVLVGPLILQPALTELSHLRPGTPEYRDWAGLLFWIPPLAGGFCGLWGGYLADRFGRRRILTYSILVYAFSATASGLAASVEWLLLFRTIAFAGTCVEFVAAVAWIAEIFPDPKAREAALGSTQAFASLGGVLTAGAFYVANRWGSVLPAIYGSHSAWRYALIAGVAPALPLAIIRPFLPESPQWEHQRVTGTLKRPSVRELFSPQFRRVTIVTALLFACAYGAAFGTIQQSPQITPGLPEVGQLAPAARGQAISSVQGAQEIGGLAGRIVLAALALIVVSRRRLLRMFLIPGLAIVPVVFLYMATQSLEMFRIGIFFAGFTTGATHFLGQLSASRLPGAPARNRRRIRRQCRRTHARHLGRARHHAPRRAHAGKLAIFALDALGNCGRYGRLRSRLGPHIPVAGTSRRTVTSRDNEGAGA
jgi:MFS family permease